MEKTVMNESAKNRVLNPKLAKVLVSLHAVYKDFTEETDRAQGEYGVHLSGRIDDFVEHYNAMCDDITDAMGKIMAVEVNSIEEDDESGHQEKEATTSILE